MFVGVSGQFSHQGFELGCMLWNRNPDEILSDVYASLMRYPLGVTDLARE